MKLIAELELFLVLVCGMVVASTNVHSIKKRDARAEQERIMNHQMKLQNFLRFQDSGDENNLKSERLQCYSCRNARTNEECNAAGLVTCLPTETSCQTEIRVFNPRNRVNVRIRKGCKQDRACNNNFLQNDRLAWPSTQCNDIPRTMLSVCRYCCTAPGCNSELPDHVCGPLDVPIEGSMKCTQNSGMRTSTCTFTCDKCHRMSGSRVRMCLENSMWSGADTKCVYDESLPGCAVATTCSAATTIPPTNGHVECSDGLQFGSECRFTCDRGYVLNGKRVLRCDEVSKEWDGERPVCVRGDDGSNPCHPFALFEYAPDGKLECACMTGFTGDGFITCEDIDECSEGRDFCDENAECVNTVRSYSCKCKPGYEGDGFECGDINECTSGLSDCDPENGICANEDGGYSCICAAEYIGDGRNCTKIELVCPGGLIGDVCLSDALAVLEEITPEEMPLEPDSLIEEPEVDSCVRMVEHNSIIRDSSMYEIINNKLLKKLMSTSNNTRVVMGPWIGLDDRVEPGVLRWRDGMELDNQDFQMWAPGQPRLIDHDGFGNCVNLVSDPVGSHTTSFLWKITLCSSPLRYVCETEKNDEPDNALCFPLAKISKGMVSCTTGWRPGSVCSFSCEEGYVLRGPSSRVTCQESDMMWDNEAPVCVRAVCSRPLVAPNSGDMECTNGNKEHSVCSFSCREGYKLHGNATVTCQRNLKWSSQRPCCRDDCPPYARMNLILVLDTSRSIGRTNFGKIKMFAKKLQGKFEVSEDFTHVSAITYSDEINLISNKTVYTSNEELELALDNLPYKGSGTLIGKALTYVNNNLVKQREASHDVVVLLTDGISHDDVYRPANALKASGVHLVAVGVKHAWRYQLHLIASEPTAANVVQVETYDDLDLIVQSISEKVCKFQC